MDENRRDEIAEAVEAADEALAHLHRAQDLLHSARNWGALDIFAGGFISSLVKRGKMSGAQDELDDARDALARLSRELRDIDGIGGFDLAGSRLSFAADAFFDNAFFDLYVQGQIDDARYHVNRAIGQVEDVRNRLLTVG